MKNGWKKAAVVAVAVAAGQMATSAVAGDLIYTPRNPSFGGNPSNFDSLIGLAQIQNPYTSDGGDGGGGSSAPTINFPPIVIDLGGAGDSGSGSGS